MLDEPRPDFLGIVEKPSKNNSFTGIGTFCYIPALSGQVAEWLKALVSKSTNIKSHHKITIINQTVKFINFSVVYLHMCYTLFADGVSP